MPPSRLSNRNKTPSDTLLRNIGAGEKECEIASVADDGMADESGSVALEVGTTGLNGQAVRELGGETIIGLCGLRCGGGRISGGRH